MAKKKTKKKRPPGRPKLDPGEAREFMLRVRLTKAMQARLAKAAKKAGTTMSEFTRRLLATELEEF